MSLSRADVLGRKRTTTVVPIEGFGDVTIRRFTLAERTELATMAEALEAKGDKAAALKVQVAYSLVDGDTGNPMFDPTSEIELLSKSIEWVHILDIADKVNDFNKRPEKVVATAKN